MSRRNQGFTKITTEMVLRAYSIGIFPMAETADDPSIHWIEPKRRGIIPLDGLHVSRSLAKLIRSDRFQVAIDTDFQSVIEACATTHGSTWINLPIRSLFSELFEKGHVHSVEVYEKKQLVGGLYGLALGGAFFGESMFHTVTNASKVALVHLVARLNAGGFCLLDTQFLTPHLATLGAIEIDRMEYKSLLANALSVTAEFPLRSEREPISGEDVLKQINPQN
jgi:leucyl/phenylalanyl-tRNA--protein transferase